MSSLRAIEPPRRAAPPGKVSIRTRLKGLSETDELVLREVGKHLGSLAGSDLAARCRLGAAHTSKDWAARKQGLTSESSARWAGAITKASNEAYATARRNLRLKASEIRRAVATIEGRLGVPAGEKRDRVRGYASEAERHAKRRRLQQLEAKLVRAESDLEAGSVSVCRGGGRLLKKRLHLEEAGLTEDEWRERWEASRCFLEANGEAGKRYGNECIRVEPSGRVSIRLPEPLAHLANAPHKRYVLDATATFSYRGDEWLARASADKAVAYKLRYCPQKGRWYVDAAFTLEELPEAPGREDATREGAIGVDLNAAHLSAWRLDVGGNPIGRPRHIPLELEGLPASTRDGRLRAAISEVLRYAREAGMRAIVVEDLGFDDARAEGRETMGRGKRGRRFRRQVAGIPTARFRERLVAMASKLGIAVIAVDPAYTSKWGAAYWQKPLRCSRHEAAAVTIGRRGLGRRARRKARVAPAPLQSKEAEALTGASGAGHCAGRREYTRGGQGEAAAYSGGPASLRGVGPYPADGSSGLFRSSRTVRDGPPL